MRPEDGKIGIVKVDYVFLLKALPELRDMLFSRVVVLDCSHDLLRDLVTYKA